MKQTIFSSSTDLSNALRASRSGLTIERPAWGLKTKNLQTPAKRRTKAFNESKRAFARRTGPILLFDGEVGPNNRRPACSLESHDEHNQTDILTSGMKPRSRLPGLLRNQWLWEFVARYSGATVPDSHGVPERLAVIQMDKRSIGFKEQVDSTRPRESCQAKVRRLPSAATVF